MAGSVQAKDKHGKPLLKDRGNSDGRLDFSKQLLRCTTRGGATIDFLADTLSHVLKVSGCDAIELWLKETEEVFRCATSLSSKGSCDFRIITENPCLDKRYEWTGQIPVIDSDPSSIRRYADRQPGMQKQKEIVL